MPKTVDIILGILVALTWGMGLVFAKAAIGHFPPILLMAFRFTVTALAMIWFFPPPRGAFRALIGIAFISCAVQYSLTFSGLARLDAGVAGLIVQLEVPFLTLLGAFFLGEKTGLRKWIGIGLAFLGVYIISGEPRVAEDLGAVFLVIGGAATWAIGQALIRKLENIDGLTLTAWIALMAAPQLFFMSAVFETGHLEAILEADWVVWGSVLYLGLVMTAIGYGMWYTLIRRNPVSQAAPFLLLLPVFTIAGGVTFLGETLTTPMLIGGAIVLAGVSSIFLEDRKAEA
ncbi:DMT family transporter [Alphaproteobacteria bacterium LSUCC0684]